MSKDAINKPPLTPELSIELGAAIFHLLGLDFNEADRVDTLHGDKTLMGLGRTINRIFNDEDYRAELNSLYDINNHKKA